MRVWIGLLTCLLAGGQLYSASTNLVEILRQFQAQLDAKEKGITASGSDVLWRAGAVESAPQSSAAGAEQEQQVKEEPSPEANQAMETRVEPGERRLRSGDIVKVEVVDEPDLSTNRVMVGEGGALRLPLVGDVRVGGKTLAEATEVIRVILGEDYLVRPRVKLTLLEEAWPSALVVPRAPPAERAAEADEAVAEGEAVASRGPCSFTIGGMVRNPGSYQWNCEQQMSLLRAIGMAGGTAPGADTTRLTIRRRVESEMRETVYDLRSMSAESGRPLPMLKPGDRVEVPRR